MPYGSWIARSETTEPVENELDMSYAFTGYLAMVNNSTTSQVDVRFIGMDPNHGNEYTGTSVQTMYSTVFELRNITACSGGTAIAACKHTSASSDLPSQVKFVFNPDSVTTNGIHTRFYPYNTMRQVINTAAGNPFYRGPGVMHRRDRGFNGVYRVCADLSEQAITLREGEGITIQPSAYGFMLNHKIAVTFRTTGGATYTGSFAFYGNGPLKPVFALFNGSSSGVVLEVVEISVAELQEFTTWMGRFRLLYGNMRLVGGDTVTPLKLNSATSDAPDVVVKKNVGVVMMDDEDKFQYMEGKLAAGGSSFSDDWKFLSTYESPWNRKYDYASHLNLMRSWHLNWQRWFDLGGKSYAQGFVLKPGQGIAIATKSLISNYYTGVGDTTTIYPMCIENWDVVFEYTMSALPSGGYPLQGDVEAGVVYGASSEYTGDFHVPAEADVKVGVGYGNAGTEFTGEYAGGGGGVSRGRVVNT